MNFLKSFKLATALLALLTVPVKNLMAAEAATPFTLKAYLAQVGLQNNGYAAGILQIKAFEARMAEGSLDFVPQLVGGYSYLDEKKVPLSALTAGLETTASNTNLGVQTKLRTGTIVNFNYATGYTQIQGSSVLPNYAYYTASPALMISQPLWRDFGASVSKATEEAIQTLYKMQAAQTKFSNGLILSNAEAAYWRLALYRQIVQQDRDAIDRTDKILAWNKKRFSMNVTDKSDLLISEAALKGKQLQLQTDLELLRQTGSQFNSLRNLPGDKVTESLPTLESAGDSGFAQDLVRSGIRADVQAMRFKAQNERATARVSKGRVEPDISLFGMAQFNGNGLDNTSAMDKAWNSDHPTYAVGVKFSVPLDGSVIHRINEGYEASASATELAISRANFELDQDWNDLKKKYDDAIVRLKVAKELESLQFQKLDHERTRLKGGRSTSYQVFQFEDNYSDAVLAKLRIQSEIFSIRAQARLFNGEAL